MTRDSFLKQERPPPSETIKINLEKLKTTLLEDEAKVAKNLFRKSDQSGRDSKGGL